MSFLPPGGKSELKMNSVTAVASMSLSLCPLKLEQAEKWKGPAGRGGAVAGRLPPHPNLSLQEAGCQVFSRSAPSRPMIPV